jgi:hypothetical protein
MNRMRSASLFLAIVGLAVAMAVSTGVASASARSVYHGGTYFGSVVVEPGQEVDGDLNVLFGNAIIEGTVNGDVNVFGGRIDIRSGSVTGQTHAVLGSVVQSVVPWAPDDQNAINMPYAPDHRVWWRVAWDVVVVVFFLIFPVRSRMALDRLEQHPGLAVAAGLCGWVAVIPVAILLACTILLIPLIPLEFAALAVALFVGQSALALLVGRRFYELLQPHATPSPLLALVLGLVLLTAAELVPVAGVLVTLLVGLVGVGAVLLTFVGEPNSPFAGSYQSTVRPPIGGPPMAPG